MAGLAEEVVKGFKNTVRYTKVVTKTLEGANRYKDLIRSHKGLIPVPSILINGRLVFRTIPGKEELEDVLNSFISGQY
jgi:predicted thioredoxin/glutaredoxin